jgi:carboxyl-terminal processing protease
VGVIDLPTFYGKGGGDSNFSTTDDVRELIGKLKASGVQGLVLDLRRNGGGFLNEAIDLTGLFIPQGPVLQVRDTLGRLERLSDTNPAVAWDGPLLLLVSKMSASATEIMTGALQDYHRALVVGDHNTHGKGTVQAVYDFDRIDPSEKGAAKVTIQKWYLPDGNSIQSKGVAADIVLPSTIDYLPIGEADQKHALVWDSVPALPLTLKGEGAWRDALVDDPLMTQLRNGSMVRQGKLDEFSFLKDRITWEKARQEQKEYSLNYNERLQQRISDIDYRDKLKARLEAMVPANFKSTDVLLDAAKAQEAEKSKTAKADDKMPSPAAAALSGDDDDAEAPINFDIQLREGLRIMSDWLVAEQDRAKLPDSAVKLAAKTDATPTDGTAATTTAPTVPRAQ